MKKPCRKILCILVSFLMFLPAFFLSCSKSAERLSFTSALDEIDALINQNQFKDAEKELGKVEKYAFSSWSEIGIFRRYKQILCLEKAEKVLQNAIKKNPENLELNAVYANFLLRENRMEDALRAGKVLQGTDYGSIYSEIVMKDTLNKSDSKNIRQVFESTDYFPVFYDAYVGTKDNAWLRNCALMYLANGEYSRAGQLLPEEVYGADDSYFWALLSYDAGQFADSVNFCNTSEKLLKSASGKILQKVDGKSLFSLLSDSYLALSDAEMAERVRQNFLQTIQDYKGQWILPENYQEDLTFPIIFTNSAKWARDNQNDEKCLSYLSFAVTNWPDYVPALCAYADFALYSNQERIEDSGMMELRDHGLATLEMERYDNRVRVPVSDASFRIDESLKRVKNPLLYIVRQDIRYKVEEKLTDKEKTADIWRILEKNMISPAVYDELLLLYAENYFLTNKLYDDAWKLFYKYISKKYNISTDGMFWQNLIKNIHDLSSEELSLASYFAALSLRAEDAKCLYENYVFEKGNPALDANVGVIASDSACMNLALIYNSLGLKDMALALYGKTNGRSSSLYIKSLAMYRMALIYYKDEDLKNSRRCAEYSLSLDKRNSEARLLLAKMNLK
ncbi:MAG: tetratricopeptide repeat protein [Treponema sp.]|nr:tetratricopeptide repeat protein [Treponema sp.]